MRAVAACAAHSQRSCRSFLNDKSYFDACDRGAPVRPDRVGERASGSYGHDPDPEVQGSFGYQLFRAGEVCEEEEVVGGEVVETCTPDRVFPFGIAGDFV